jgi:glycerol-3-phosphate dehydrogenase
LREDAKITMAHQSLPMTQGHHESGQPMAGPGFPNRDPKTGQLRLDEATGWPAYDLVIIGGGINGTGIARDAAQRGLSVLLLEKADFGAGASAYSSRLIHGGLRYLANFELDLVRESLRERDLLLKNAPHLAKPLPMAIPVYKNGQNPLWKIELGMWLYDILSWGKPMPAHRLLSREQFLQAYPGVNPEGLQGGPVYYDAQAVLPERICIENTLAALESRNASMLNHAKVEGFEVTPAGLHSLHFQDLQSGQRHTVGGQVFINASGPWVDEILKLSASPATSPQHLPRMGGTKGTHIVVNRFPSAPKTALYVEARADGRPFFIIPWRDDTLLIGTTDTHYPGNLDAVIPSAEEVAYLVAETNHILPEAKLSEADILYAYAGVRPLPFAQGKTASKVTRKHWIIDHAQDTTLPVNGLLSIIGGKLTTYRNLAEEAVDYAVTNYHLSLTNGHAVPPSDTQREPLPGGQGIANWADYQAQHIPVLCQEFELCEQTVSTLLSLYGSRINQVLGLLRENSAWRTPLSAHSKTLAVQVVYAVRHELACTVEDVLLRRLGTGLDADLGFFVLEPAARLMGDLLGWPEDIIQAEIRKYKSEVTARNLAFKKGACAPL